MRDIATKSDGTTTLSASDFNANLGSEIENLVNATDQSLDPAGGPDTDLNMMGKAAAAYANAASVYQDSGVADTYVLAIASNLKSVTKYYSGMRITFKPGNTNTGASTVNINALGAKAITLQDGTVLSPGMIANGEYTVLIYNLSSDRFEISALGQRAVDFELLDLIIKTQSIATVDANAKLISLLNSLGIRAYIDNLDRTLTMPTDLEAGTTEKISTWYGIWVASNGTQKLVPDLMGTTDSTSAGKLADSTATLLTDVVHAGDIAYNLTTLAQTSVSLDATAEGEVSVTDDIFTSGDDYVIVKISPVGLGEFKARIGVVYNNSGSDFDSIEIIDRVATINTAAILSAGTASIFTKVNFLNAVPITAKEVNITSTASRAGGSLIDASISNDIGNLSIYSLINSPPGLASNAFSDNFSIPINVPGIIYYRAVTSGTSININLNGFKL